MSTTHERRGALIAWAFYDWATSAYAALIQTFLFPAYFARAIAPDAATGTAWWGNAMGIAGLTIAVSAPLLGAIADRGGHHRPRIPRKRPSGFSEADQQALGRLVERRLGVQLVDVDTDQLGDALLFHGHAVEHVRDLDRPLVMRDHEELALLCHLDDQLIEAADVRVIERRIDLVEQEEGTRSDLEHGDQ